MTPMNKSAIIFGAIALVIGVPVGLKQSHKTLNKKTDDVLIVITPHNEAIRFEMEAGFQRWYKEKTGRTVSIDWRIPGSTGEVIRYVDSVFVNSFRLYWENVLHKVWDQSVQASFSNPSMDVSNEARTAFLASNVGCGVDVIFGGGVIEHKHEAAMGQLVDSGVVKKHPEWFCDAMIPYKLAGDCLWDKEGRWIGSSLSSFGIVYNVDRLLDLHVTHHPKQWVDLTDPRFFKQIAMVDPVQSSIVVKCFEMMIQQQMQLLLKQRLEDAKIVELSKEQLHFVLNEGWMQGLRMIQKIMANSRYFTDNSVSTIWDISIGNCTVGVIVDFYGRYQRDILRMKCHSNRVDFAMPKSGSAVSPDPISMFRGAPHPKLASTFIEYVVSEEGQDRIGLKVGSPHGPQWYPLSRTPIRKDFYVDAKRPYMLTPDLNPFASSDDFEYHPEWTAAGFKSIRFLSKVLFMDTYTELSKAWKAIIDARYAGRTEDADQALAVFEDLSTISYDWMLDTLRPLLNAKRPLKEIQLSTALTCKFREQYLRAYKVATYGQ
ncbi:MAG: extracellular solute-binding protein [Puniceicoccales bacterium]|nr:extracellular solute-binding protein [Puniceicoccales bacterium]